MPDLKQIEDPAVHMWARFSGWVRDHPKEASAVILLLVAAAIAWKMA